ncbi:MAG: RsmB/NOP family class I SAM-dependent RNA methyltransferase [Bacteroidia bacterium]
MQQIFNEGKYADKAIEKVLASDNRWGARDRGFIAENTYDMVRWWRLLSFVSGETKTEYETELTPEKGWHLFGIWLLLSGKEKELPVWREFKKIDGAEVAKLSAKASGIRKVRESIPDWMDELGEKELGSNWDKELKALNQTAHVIIRANTLKTTRSNLKDVLDEAGIETSTLEGYNDALVLKHRTNLFKTPFFKQGCFEVQDAASQMVSSYLEVEPNMRVIDACAGAGGKTLHLAALMQNKGKVIAMDKEQWKLDVLKLRARRAGAHNIELRPIENSKTIKRLHESADRLLLDVPCSGLGVLKRNPDAKWKLSIEFIERIRKSQTEILNSYSGMLKSGGLMVYATCSILPSEGEYQITRFLSENKIFQQLKELRISPETSGLDGFYMTLLRKS